ncbi:MAG: EVE domain-containing protein [Bacteroidia bacterium]|nr:EVE domain-containing protein [Bacteroidia bacterium]MDA8629196.1 EVE domain-containing protein [Bacteroidia bacterium]
MNYWLIKSEPFKYSWEQFETDKETFWDGVRNYQARNNLRDMQVGDLCLYYHSNEGKEVVGIAEVIKPPYQDPTTDNTQWVAVDVKPYKKLDKTVTLAQIKADPRLSDIGLIRQPRLSVISISEDHFNIILELANEP